MAQIEFYYKKLKTKRNNINLSLGELAELTGLGKTTIYNIEEGLHSPSIKNFMKLCDALEVRPNQFFSGL